MITVTGSGDARASASALTVAGLLALLASSCCVLPLVLVLAGVTGAWMARLRVLEPWSNGIAALAVAALAFAAWRLWRRQPRDACAAEGVGDAGGAGEGSGAGEPCAITRPWLRRWFWLVALLTVVPIAVPLLAPLFY